MRPGCKTTAFAALSLGLLLAATGAAEPLVRPNDRLAICGDSMTANLGYACYVQDYLVMCEQVPGLEVSQFGWHSQTAAEFLSHLEADLLPFKPTVVITCFGMNDGGYKALESETAEKYRQAQIGIVQALKKAGVRTVILGSPRSVDPAVYRGGPAKAAEYNQTLAALADIDRQVAAAEGAVYADVFGVTSAAMQKAKTLFGEKYAYDPENGSCEDKSSLAIAYAFLKALGCAGQIGTITADFAASRATCDTRQTIFSFDDHEGHLLSIESRRYPFWFPAYPSGTTAAVPFLGCLPFNEELNRYLLVVNNLPTADAKIIWRAEAHDYTASELRRGINLAEFYDNPFAGHVQNVDHQVRDQQQQERISGQLLLANHAPDLPGLAKRDTFRRQAFEQVVPVKHALRIQPLAPAETPPRGKVPVIVDTDLSSDCDDAGAIALLNTFMNQGEATLLACVANGHDRDLSCGATIQAINAYYGHGDVPIGTYHGTVGFTTGSQYTLPIHKRFAPDFPHDDKLPKGVDVYRRALAGAADGTVVIVSLGFLQNLDELLRSAPDAVSELAGPELVRKKVRRIVIMNNQQKEDEFVVTTWPTDILWTMDVGNHVFTGKSLAETPENNPVRVIYGLHGDAAHNSLRDGRQSWDLTASWLAVRGTSPWWDVAVGGLWKVDTQAGGGRWVDGPETNQRLVLFKLPPAEITRLIESELARPPSADKK